MIRRPNRTGGPWTGLLTLVLVCASALPGAAKAPARPKPADTDMRGQWRLTWTIHYPTDTIAVRATMVVRGQDRRTGALSGRYDILPQTVGKREIEEYHSRLTGTVRGARAHLITTDGEFDVKLREGPKGLTFRGSQREGEIWGDVVGTRDSAWVRTPTVIPVCVRGLASDGSSVECLLTITDTSEGDLLVTPTGTVRITLAGSGRPPERCTLVATRTGAASCRATIELPAVPPSASSGPGATRAPSPTTEPASLSAMVDYGGDDRFDPGELTTAILPMDALDAAATAGLVDALAAVLRRSRDIIDADQRDTLDRVLPQMDGFVEWLRERSAQEP